MERCKLGLPRFFATLESELGEVYKATEVLSRFPAGDQARLLDLMELPPLALHLRPALVILVGRVLNSMCDRLVALAAMVQLVFLGMMIHGRVGEDGPRPDDRNRLAILIGDYNFSRFFALAAEAGMTEFLRPLAQVICRLNEGAMARLHQPATPEAVREAVSQETADLIAVACRMAGQLCGGDAGEQETLYRLGYDLGMGYGLMERGVRAEARRHLQEARERLSQFPSGHAREALDALIAHLMEWPGQSGADAQAWSGQGWN